MADHTPDDREDIRIVDTTRKLPDFSARIVQSANSHFLHQEMLI